MQGNGFFFLKKKCLLLYTMNSQMSSNYIKHTEKMVTILTLHNLTKKFLQQNMTITGSTPFYKTMKNVLPCLDKRFKECEDFVVVSLFVGEV